jgi:peptidoglycan/xylan/chitin deacetylase (PgdA/CDA1 family)
MVCTLGLHHVARWWNRHRLLIVCYHGVCDGPTSPEWLLLPQAQFRIQLRYLKRHYRCVPIDAALAELRGGGLSGPTACITFDDGYRNNLELALPVLRELNVPATVYLTTGLVGTTEHLWTTRLQLALERVAPDVDLRAIGIDATLPAGGRPRRTAAQEAGEAMKRLPTVERETRLAKLHATVPQLAPVASLQIMNWREVRRMAESGLVSFGAHTVHHDVLSRSDSERVRREIHQSIHDVETSAGATSRTFAYPNGRVEDFDDRAVAALREAGVMAGLTTIDGLNDAATNPYSLRRITVGGSQSFDDFRIATSGLSTLLRGRDHATARPSARSSPSAIGSPA